MTTGLDGSEPGPTRCPLCGDTGHEEALLVGGIKVIGCPKLTGDRVVMIRPAAARDVDGDDWAECLKAWRLP